MQNIWCNNFIKHLTALKYQVFYSSTLLKMLLRCLKKHSQGRSLKPYNYKQSRNKSKAAWNWKKNHPSFHKNRIHSGSIGFKIFFFYSLTTVISHFQTLKSCHFSQQKIQNVHLSAELLLADIHFQYKSFLNIQSKCWILCCEFKFLHMGKYVQYQSEYLEKLCVKKLIITFTEHTHTQNHSLHLIFSKCYSQHLYK